MVTDFKRAAPGAVLKDEVDGALVRLLYLDFQKDAAVLIRLNSNTSVPFWVTAEELVEGLSAGSYSMAPPGLAHQFDCEPPKKLTRKQEERQKQLCGIFQPFLSDCPNCFRSTVRIGFLNRLRDYGMPRTTARRLLHNYWASNCSMDAFIPRFEKRGRKPKVQE